MGTWEFWQPVFIYSKIIGYLIGMAPGEQQGLEPRAGFQMTHQFNETIRQETV